jgi:hypothetical protein
VAGRATFEAGRRGARVLAGRRYKKVTDGTNLFLKASPERVYAVCPYLRKLLDEMLATGKAAGL